MKRKIIQGISCFFLAIFITACQHQNILTKEPPVYENTAEMVAVAKEMVDEISVQELKSRLPEETLYLIDVRTPTETDAGFIPEAVLIPRGILEFTIGSEDFWEENNKAAPQKNDPIILYCRSGNRSALAGKSLMKLGYKNVKSLKGGWKDWERNNP